MEKEKCVFYCCDSDQETDSEYCSKQHKMMEENKIPPSESEAVEAYLESGISDNLDDFLEAYQGTYRSDIDFVQNLLDDTGGLPKDLPSYIHIDWESTARDIMYDYTEQDGHYFRNL